jgi:hypothetical protein
MNTKQEVERHLVEARKHLEIMAVYLGGFDNYKKSQQVRKALEAINTIAEEYFCEDIRDHEDAM